MDPDPDSEPKKTSPGSGDVDDGDEWHSSEENVENPKALPDDLPTSLDDRRSVPTFAGEMEMYDGWQGMSGS